jgi:hypothetical protein
MLLVMALDPCRRRAADVASLGQLLGRRIHHATPRPILPVAITMVRAALSTALMLVASATKGLFPGSSGASPRAVLAAPSIAALTDYEIAVTPPALELAPKQHQSPAENWARR